MSRFTTAAVRLIRRVFHSGEARNPASLLVTAFAAGLIASGGFFALPLFPTSAQVAPPAGTQGPASPQLKVIGAHCHCAATCNAGSKQFTRTISFPGYIQGIPGQRDRCKQACDNWVDANMEKWGEEEKVCDSFTCSGTSHVGTENRNNWRTLNIQAKVRTCCPPGSNGEGCPPTVGTDIRSVFQQAQVGGITGNVFLTYNSLLNSAYDPAFQIYASYVKTQRPTMNHMWVGYGLYDMTDPANPVFYDWLAVKYYPGGSGGVPTVAGYAQPLQVGRTYAVYRLMYFKDANDRDVPYFGEATCPWPNFHINLSVWSQRSTAPGGPGRVIARISAEGGTVREVVVEPETAAQSAVRQRSARDRRTIQPPEFRPEVFRTPEMMRRLRPPASPQSNR